MVAITRASFTFLPATRSDSATAESSRICRRTTLRSACRDFSAENEWHTLEDLVREVEKHADSAEVTEQLRRQAQEKEHAAKKFTAPALENQTRKNRFRWLRQALADAGMRRANELGWPNTYTFTKSLSESFIRKFLDDSPHAAIAVVRPAIVESSIEKPFLGWNEGINTSASLSYLLGTFFRQLPSNASKCLDLIPVDLVAAGMTLISAALVDAPARARLSSGHVRRESVRHAAIDRTDRLGPSKVLPRAKRFESPTASKFDAIPVSKSRYEKLSAPAQKMIVQMINRTVEPMPFMRPPFARQERDLERVIKLIAFSSRSFWRTTTFSRPATWNG